MPDSTAALFDALRQTADRQAADAVEALVSSGADSDLARINPLSFASEHSLDEDVAIAALLHATQLGLVEMSWNVLCPSCGGVLDANTTLKSVRNEEYHCAFCSVSTEAVLDESVEVSFTLSPRIRRIGVHDPDTLGFWDYHQQIFFGSAFTFPPPDAFKALAAKALLEQVELRSGERVILALDIGREPLLIFDPITHTTTMVAVEGEPTTERQDAAVVFSTMKAVHNLTLRPGPLRLVLDNRSAGRVLVGVFVVGPSLELLLGERRPYLSAKRLLCNQAFRDLYRTDTLAVDQRLKITNLTFLFTDLKGSTDLYERVGDLVAYDLVRSHFRMLGDIVASEGGAVVKTIGDAVMATFPTPRQALAAALRMRNLGGDQATGPLALKVGLHAGPCLAVNLNDRQDYFGQTVNIASRVQELANSDSIFATGAIVSGEASAKLLEEARVEVRSQERSLRGIGNLVPVFELT